LKTPTPPFEANPVKDSRQSTSVTTAVEMVHIWRLANGRIVEHWAVRDDLSLMVQLDVVESG
jgi:predicted SnoaL-like aldol condensation-catalyzing enzyme